MSNYTSKQGYWDTKTTAEFLGIGKVALNRLRAKGIIPCIRLSRKVIRFEPDKVRETMSKLSTGGAA